MDFVDHNSFRHIPQKFGRVQFVVGSVRLDDLGLIFQRKVGVMVGGIDVLDVEIENLVVRNDARVGKIVYSRQPLLGHCQRCGEHLSENGHGVGNVNDLFVLDNLGDKVAMKKIIRHGHADTKNEAIRITLEHGLHVSLGLTVKGTSKVRNIFFGESNALAERVLFIVFA